MTIKTEKYMNRNIFKALVLSALTLALIGFAINFAFDFTGNSHDNIERTKNYYAIGALGLLVLIYVSQVFWLQKPLAEDKKTFGMNPYTVTAACFLLYYTKMGTQGLFSDSYFPVFIFSYGEGWFLRIEMFLVVLMLLASIILSLVVLLVPRGSIIVILVLLTAAYSFFMSGTFLGYMFPLIYAFAYIDFVSKKELRIKGMTEVLFLCAISMLSFIISIITYGFMFFSYNSGEYGGAEFIFTSTTFAVFTLATAIILYLSWKKDSFRLLITATIVSVIHILAMMIMQMVQLLAFGLGDVWDSYIIETLLYTLFDNLLSPFTIFLIIALYKMRRRKNTITESAGLEPEPQSKKYKTRAVILILVSFLTIAGSSILPGTLAMKNVVRDMESETLTEILPGDVYDDEEYWLDGTIVEIDGDLIYLSESGNTAEADYVFSMGEADVYDENDDEYEITQDDLGKEVSVTYEGGIHEVAEGESGLPGINADQVIEVVVYND